MKKDNIVETKAPVVALSGFLTLAYDSMKETVEAIKAAGLRDSVKIMIGGGTLAAGGAQSTDVVDAVFVGNTAIHHLFLLPPDRVTQGGNWVGRLMLLISPFGFID